MAWRRNWQMLAALRGLMGFAEGSAQPGGMKAVAEWFPAKERGFAGGFYNIGASFGSMLAAPLVAWAILFHSWRLAFVIAGGLALVWVALWFKFYYSPKDHPKISAEERDYIESGQEAHLAAGATKTSIFNLLKQRNVWGIAIPRMLADPTWGTLAFWVPFYLTTERRFDLKQIALFAWLPFVTADIGCMAGPTIVLWLQRRGIGLINARRWAFTVGALLMTSMAFVGKVDSPYVAIMLLCLGGFAHQTLSITVITMSSDLFRRNEVATVAGIGGFCGNLGVLLFTLLIGGLVKTVGYDPFFVALAVFDILAPSGCGRWCANAAPRRARGGSPMIRNPILPGFNPDPSILRVGDDYYIATSTFEWYPGVQIHHSRDLVNWRLLTRPLRRASQLNMLGDPDSCGVWAPCLTYAEGFSGWSSRTSSATAARRSAAHRVRRCAISTTIWSRVPPSMANGPMRCTSTAAASIRRCFMTMTGASTW